MHKCHQAFAFLQLHAKLKSSYQMTLVRTLRSHDPVQYHQLLKQYQDLMNRLTPPEHLDWFQHRPISWLSPCQIASQFVPKLLLTLFVCLRSFPQILRRLIFFCHPRPFFLPFRFKLGFFPKFYLLFHNLEVTVYKNSSICKRLFKGIYRFFTRLGLTAVRAQ